MRFFQRVIVVAGLVLTAGCGSNAVARQLPQAAAISSSDALRSFAPFLPLDPAEAASGPAFLSREARATKDPLYAGHGGEVLIFPQAGPHRQDVIGRITEGINGAWGMSVDSSPTLYVANNHSGSVTLYPRGSLMPSLVLTTGLSHPSSVAVGSDGTVYVCDGGTGEVDEFPAGQTSPSLVIPPVVQSSFEHLFPTDATLDRNNNLYVGYVDPYGEGGDYGFGIVFKYKPGSTRRIATHVIPRWVADIQFDGAGHLVLAVESRPFPPAGLLVYHLKPRKLLRRFGDRRYPWAMRFASDGNRVFVGDVVQHKIFVYFYPSGALAYTISKPIGTIWGLAASPPATF